MGTNRFLEFKNDLSRATDNLSMKEAIYSDRKGSRKLRDYIVFLKMAWTESLSYFVIIQTAIIYTALMPNSITNINDAFRICHIPYQFPVGATSVFSIVLIGALLIFGVISYRFFGLARRANEVSGLYSPVHMLLYNKLIDIERKLDEMKK